MQIAFPTGFYTTTFTNRINDTAWRGKVDNNIILVLQKGPCSRNIELPGQVSGIICICTVHKWKDFPCNYIICIIYLNFVESMQIFIGRQTTDTYTAE